MSNAMNALEKKREISYGLCISNEAVMSCYVPDMEDSHVHFVDGSEGGYTRAAGTLSKKIVPSLRDPLFYFRNRVLKFRNLENQCFF